MPAASHSVVTIKFVQSNTQVEVKKAMIKLHLSSIALPELCINPNGIN